MKKIFSILFFVAISYNVAQAQLITTSQGVRTTHIRTIKKQNTGVKGFEQMAEVALAQGRIFSGGVEYIAGYRFNNLLFLGAGIGVKGYEKKWFDNENDYRGYDYLADCEYSFPLYLHSRFYFTKRKIKPFASLSLGVNICDEERVGIHFNPSVGMSYCINKNLEWYLSGGFMMQHHCYYDEWAWEDYYDFDLGYFFSLRAGFTF